MNKFLKEFKDRGFFYQCTAEDDLSKLLDKKKLMATLVLTALLKAFMLVAYFR